VLEINLIAQLRNPKAIFAQKSKTTINPLSSMVDQVIECANAI